MGECLTSFIQEAGLNPDRVVFIDDKAKNVQDVESALNRRPLEHISFRYGAAAIRSEFISGS